MKRVCLIVLDGVGVGALPDASVYGDSGSNTVGHVAESENLFLPNMASLGLGHIEGTRLPKAPRAVGGYGRGAQQSKGKDTTTGHWEIAGLRLKTPFPTYPNGFPEDVIKAFEEAIQTKVIGNYASSGTAILDELGEEHIKTGHPIVYTSADSVFQIACHEAIYPIESLYRMCLVAREMLSVGRVIARPFTGTVGAFSRTANRRDFSLEPIGPTLLDALVANKMDSLAVGKIEDIFCMRGITKSNHASGNPACIDATIAFLKQDFSGLLFANLVDFDMHYGHRNDSKGFAEALAYFDARLPEIIAEMTHEDLLVITADHGCDPTFKGTDHTREYIPILCYHKSMTRLVDIGTRKSFADIAATIAEALDVPDRFGAESFYEALREGENQK